MDRNIEGLKRSAHLRREDVLQRALTALSRIDASGDEINFRTVANEGRVSRAWLYNHQELRGRIMRLRRTQTRVPSPEAERADSECLSRKSVIATLRLRIKKLEAKNRELAEQLEHAYGVIANSELRTAVQRS
jgi:hypothetical protein